MLYTLVASAARHHLDVWAYLRDVLEQLAILRTETADLPSPEQLTPLLPDVWAKANPEFVRDHRQHEQERRATAKRACREKRRVLTQAKATRAHG